MTLKTGTAAARQRGAAATSEPGPWGSGPAALLPGTLVTGPGGSDKQNSRNSEPTRLGIVNKEMTGQIVEKDLL